MKRRLHNFIELFRHSRGSAVIEYAIALAAITAVFITASQALYTAGQNQFNNSVSIVNDIVPCGINLSGVECL